MSRHRKIRLSRSKAIVIAAAGALSVATAASATAATWSQGAQGHAASSDGPTEITREAAGGPRLAVADQLTRPIAEAENQQGNATLAEHAFQLRLTQTRDAIAQRQAARKRAAELAANPGSGAYGIPQALPGSRMASAGPDWQTSAATQIRWGLQYIKDTYGSPCAAWSHSQATGWY